MNKFALGCGVLIAILLFVVVVAAIAIGGSYNRLVRLQQAVDQSWAQVQNVYQRRADLIPNLVSTVSGAANASSPADGSLSVMAGFANSVRLISPSIANATSY